MRSRKDSSCNTIDQVKHPAKYSAGLFSTFIALLQDEDPEWMIDPFAGVGGVFTMQPFFPDTKIVGVEIEEEWAAQHPGVKHGNALFLPYTTDFFDAAITSPCYGNRMADHHEAKDDSKRNTYRHTLGRPLHPDNSGQLQWGHNYRLFHRRAWRELRRVLKTGGTFILNTKDFYRAGEVQSVTDWHVECLKAMGFTVLEHVQVHTLGNRFGQNGNLRIPHEDVVKFRLGSEQ